MDTTPRVETDLYERDEYAWLGEQARALREGRLHDLDTHNLAEFLDDMAASQRRELVSRLEVLLMHWIKIEVQPKQHTKSWNITIDEQHNRVSDLLATAPSLSNYGAEAVAIALPRALRRAAMETGIHLAELVATWRELRGTFGVERRWTLEEILRYQPSDPPKRGSLDD